MRVAMRLSSRSLPPGVLAGAVLARSQDATSQRVAGCAVGGGVGKPGRLGHDDVLSCVGGASNHVGVDASVTLFSRQRRRVSEEKQAMEGLVGHELLSERVRAIKPSGIRRFFDIAATMKDVLSLGIGE